MGSAFMESIKLSSPFGLAYAPPTPHRSKPLQNSRPTTPVRSYSDLSTQESFTHLTPPPHPPSAISQRLLQRQSSSPIPEDSSECTKERRESRPNSEPAMSKSDLIKEAGRRERKAKTKDIEIQDKSKQDLSLEEDTPNDSAEAEKVSLFFF